MIPLVDLQAQLATLQVSGPINIRETDEIYG